MDYELAKKLKDAGFPNSENWDFAYLNVPTLSELIEACGDKILGLNRTHDDTGTPNGWIADTHTHECKCGKLNCNGRNWESESGPTPSEAVANLWLALNKK